MCRGRWAFRVGYRPGVRRIGLTGGIGAGKSTVARLLAGRGAVVIDADAIAREVLAPGSPGLAAVTREFGEELLHPDGSLDRPALGRLVFADDARRQRLEQITHPLIAEQTRQLTAAAGDDAVVVHDVPLLVEKGMAGHYDAVLVVEAPDELRLTRLEARGLPRDEAVTRMRAQATAEQRAAVATHVMDNSGDEQALRRRVDEVWSALTG